MESCLTCKYWLAPDKEGEPGYCRRHPPKAFMIQRQGAKLLLNGPAPTETTMMTNFPPTNADIWCGEYREA
jgi:hypothetical protein